MHPKSDNYWNEIADNWEQTNQQKLLRSISDKVNKKLFSRWLSQKKVNCILKTDLFDESLSEGLQPLLSQHTHGFFGMDLSLPTTRLAKSKHNQLKAIVADVRNLPFKSESFDVIVSNSTLDHFQTSAEIVDSLKELNRVLKGEGQLFITLDNVSNPSIFLRNILPFKILNHLGIVPYYIGKSFGPRRLKSTLESLNYLVVEVTAFWHFPRLFLGGVAFWVEKYFSEQLKQNFVESILSFECLSKLPAKYLTGQFVAARAIKRL